MGECEHRIEHYKLLVTYQIHITIAIPYSACTNHLHFRQMLKKKQEKPRCFQNFCLWNLLLIKKNSKKNLQKYNYFDANLANAMKTETRLCNTYCILFVWLKGICKFPKHMCAVELQWRKPSITLVCSLNAHFIKVVFLCWFEDAEYENDIYFCLRMHVLEILDLCGCYCSVYR